MDPACNLIDASRAAWRYLVMRCPSSILAEELLTAIQDYETQRSTREMDADALLTELADLTRHRPTSDAQSERIVLLSFALIAASAVSMAKTIDGIAGRIAQSVPAR